MTSKINPFMKKTKSIFIDEVELVITLLSAKEYLDINKQCKGSEELLTFKMISKCVRTADGDELDVDEIPIDVFAALSEKLAEEFAFTQPKNEDEKKL